MVIRMQTDPEDFYELHGRWPSFWDLRMMRREMLGFPVEWDDFEALMELNEEAMNGDHQECYEQELECVPLDTLREMLEEITYSGR